MIEIEPNPKLVQYYNESRGLFCDFDGSLRTFVNNEEWHYILSDLESNIFLIKRLEESGLLSDKMVVCDAGIGLGTTLFDIFLQSKSLSDKEFEFWGIEKEEKYIKFLNEKLIDLWEGGLNLICGDIMSQNFSKFNLVYSYSPFKSIPKLETFYDKVISELERGSILIEHRDGGLGFEKTLEKFLDRMEKIDIDGQFVFVKK